MIIAGSLLTLLVIVNSAFITVACMYSMRKPLSH